MTRKKVKFNIIDLINKFRNNEVSFEEVYQEISKSEIYKSKYAVDLLINEELHKTGTIDCEDKDKLIQLVKKDDDEINRYLLSKCTNIREKEELLDILIEHDSNYLRKVVADRYCLLYTIEHLKKENYLSNSISNEISKIYNKIDSREQRKDLFEAIMSNYMVVERLISYHGESTIFNNNELKEIYDKYKGYILSNRKGVRELYNNCIAMKRYVEYTYIKRLTDKITNKTIKNNTEISVDKFIDDLYEFNLTEGQKDNIEACLMMAKLAS